MCCEKLAATVCKTNSVAKKHLHWNVDIETISDSSKKWSHINNKVKCRLKCCKIEKECGFACS